MGNNDYVGQLISEAVNSVATQDTVILQADGLGGEYNIAVYDKPERFGVMLYGFRDEDKAKISGALSALRRQESMVAGILVELQDEDRETLEAVRQDFSIKYLLSGSKDSWAVHPSIIYSGSEVTHFSVPINIEMPEEVLPYIKFPTLIEHGK